MTIVVIIPVYNSSAMLGDTLRALSSGTRLPEEVIVVDDGSEDDSAAIAATLGARVIVMPHNVGPAACRNEGVLYSKSEILVFLDADTCVHSTTIEQMVDRLLLEPGLTGVFGSYDETPRDPGVLSQYRNLAHCYIHQSAKHAALTFWSGCGAVRRNAFLASNGFDERYVRPSIEDIELGYRMTDRSAQILLDPAIYVTHTKRWTLWNAIVTDVMARGIPWMTLLLERGRMPNDLNITRRHRVAAALTGAAFVSMAAGVHSRKWLVLSVLLIALTLWMDTGLLRFLYRKRGWRLLFVAAGMTLLQNLCKLIAVGGGGLIFIYRLLPSAQLKRGERRSRVLESLSLTENDGRSASAPGSLPAVHHRS